MLLRWLFGVTVLLMTTPLLAAEGGLPPSLQNPGYVERPAWFKESFLDLREDVAEAAKAGKGVLLYFYQDGCPYCERLINVNFAQRQISDETRRKFDVIAINMWGDREVTDLQGQVLAEKDFAKAMKVQFTPTLLFLNGKGRLILRLNGYYPPHKFLVALDYASGKGRPGESFSNYLARIAPAPASGKLHIERDFLQPPYHLVRKGAKKPLLVIFEQKECPACDELHGDVFRRGESRELLNRFDVAVIDMWSSEPLQTVTGKRMSMKAWAKQLNIQYAPSMVFFDTKGKEVFRTEAYLRPFHIQSALDYVSSGAYRQQKEFQRYVQSRADARRAKGDDVDLWE